MARLSIARTPGGDVDCEEQSSSNCDWLWHEVQVDKILSQNKQWDPFCPMKTAKEVRYDTSRANRSVLYVKSLDIRTVRVLFIRIRYSLNERVQTTDRHQDRLGSSYYVCRIHFTLLWLDILRRYRYCWNGEKSIHSYHARKYLQTYQKPVRHRKAQHRRRHTRAHIPNQRYN